jgi:hypothetical protein
MQKNCTVVSGGPAPDEVRKATGGALDVLSAQINALLKADDLPDSSFPQKPAFCLLLGLWFWINSLKPLRDIDVLHGMHHP